MDIKPGQQYINIKLEKLSQPFVYQVIVLCDHSEDYSKHVVYVSAENKELLYQLMLMLLKIVSWMMVKTQAKVWVRPYELFEEKFKE